VTFAPIPSPEQTVRLYRAGELAAELARYHDTASEDEGPFVAHCVRLHNSGEIDLLAVASTPAFAALQDHDFFVAQHLYLRAIPELRADVRSLMVCCNALIKQAGRDGAAALPNGAFQQWCTANPELAETVIRDASIGDELARQFATFALRSLNNLNAAIGFIENFKDDRRLSGMTALAGMRYADSSEAYRAVTILQRFVVAGTEDNVRSNALLAAFDILKMNSEIGAATALLSAAVEEAGPATQYALAQVVWLHHKLMDSASLGIALQGLRSVAPDNRGTITNLDMALHSLFGTANENLALDCLTDVLRDGPHTLANFDTTAHALSRAIPGAFTPSSYAGSCPAASHYAVI
jgi:hypothetical protein